MCPVRYRTGGSLLHCPSTLTGHAHPLRVRTPAVHFCCTVSGVASAGRYPASCPVKPGLSSSGTFRTASRDHLLYSHLPSYPGFAFLSTTACFAKVTANGVNINVFVLLFTPAMQTTDRLCYTPKQPPPINSRSSEFCGMLSPGIATK